MTEGVETELIRASAIILPSLLSAYAAYKAHAAANTTAETRGIVSGVATKIDGVLDARVKAATAEGHEAGVKESQ